MIHNLCRGLREAGVSVELFAIKGSTAPASRYYWTHKEEQYHHLTGQMYDAASIPMTHMLASIDRIRRSGDFDVIHDHNTLFGPSMLGGRPDLPPVLHTLHTPFSDPDWIQAGHVDTMPLYEQLGRNDRLYFNGISRSQLSQAPSSLRRRIVGAIHHGIDPSEHQVITKKSDYFVNVGRISEDKGIDVAVRACAEMGAKFKIAGIVPGVGGNPAVVDRELARPKRGHVMHPDFEYYRDEVAPYLKAGLIEYVGSIFGRAKDELIGRARAFLMPIQWEEPFGVAVLDALVCGTPVVAMRRGSMPEIIEHGVNGFLADTPEQFKEYMTRASEIDPLNCRRSVEERFSYRVMTQQYVSAYQRLAARHAQQPALLRRGLVRRDFAFYERLPKAITKPKSLNEYE
jgi:glycosyltransferase involved in cell wall biosynthesis